MTRSPLRGVVIHHLRTSRRRRRVSTGRLVLMLAVAAFWCGVAWRLLS